MDAAPKPKGGFWPSVRRLALICTGSVLIGVTLPVLLCLWTLSGEAMHPKGGAKPDLSLDTIAGEAVGLELIAVMFCGPGAIILGLLLYWHLCHKSKVMTEDELIHGSMWRGALIAFLNLPGFFALILLNDSPQLAVIRIISLFLVAGATSGMWVAWQVCRKNNPLCGFIPRYRLSTLMGVVFAWAVLLALFAPHGK